MANILERFATRANKKRKELQAGARDLVDANTEEDQRKRQAQGQARLYADQQKAKGAPVANNIIDQASNKLVKPVIGTGAKSVNTVSAGVKGITGLGRIGFESIAGTDQSYNDAVKNTVQAVQGSLTKGAGNQGAFFTPKQAASSGGGFKGLKNDFIKPTTNAIAEVAPLVIPGGGLVKSGNVAKRAAADAAYNTAVGGATNAAQQLVNTGNIDGKQLVQSSAVSGVLGGAAPVAGAAIRKTAQTARPIPTPQPAYSQRPRVSLEQQAQLRAVSDYNAQVGDVNDYVKALPGAQQAARQQGININQGTKDANLEAANSILDRIGERTQRPAQERTASIVEQIRSRMTPLQGNQIGAVGRDVRPQTMRQVQQVDEVIPTTQTAGQPPIEPPSGSVVAAAAPDNPNLPGAVGKQRQSQFAAKTVPESEFVSDAAKQRLNAPEYSVQTEKAGYQASLGKLQQEGTDTFTTNSRAALDKKPGTISRQEAIDATTAAQGLDALGDPTSLQKATDIYERLSEHYTAAGQLTQAAAVLARRSPQGMMYAAQKQLREANVKVTPEIQAKLKALIDGGSADKDRAAFELNQFVQSQIPSSLSDRISNVWRAGLLTAPTTTGGNLLGNTSEAAIRKGFVNPVATAADAAIGLFTGKRTQTLAPIGSGVQGAQEGAGKLKDFLKTGYDERNVLDKYDNRGPVNYGNTPAGKAVEKYATGVYRLMGTADMPFWYSAQRNALGSIAKAEAINAKIPRNQKAKWIADFMANPPESALARSSQEAAFATFQNKTGLGKAAVAFKDGLNKVIPGAGDFIVPFTQVPASIATRVITRTPIGTANEVVRQFLNVRKGGQFDQRALSQAIGEGAFGTAVLGTGYALANSGLMTFGYPADAKERSLWESEGKQPYSVKVGDRWYSLNYMQPFGTLLAVGAKAGQDIEAGKSLEDSIAGAFGTAGQSVSNQSFLKGVSGALDAINDPERSASKYVNQTSASLVPNFIRSAARATDEVQRKPEGLVEGVKQGIPGLRQQTDAKVGAFGQPLPAKDNSVNQFLNPLRPSIDRSNDPVIQEARRLQDTKDEYGKQLGVIPSTIDKASLGKDVELDSKQVRDLQARVGKSVNDQWNKFINTEQYKALSDKDKAKALSNLSTDAAALEKRKYADENNLSYNGKLDSKQQALATGNNDITTYANISNGKTGLPKNYQNLDENVQKFYAKKSGQTEDWKNAAPTDEGKDLVRRVNQIKPQGLPDLPNNNRTASYYADFVQKRDAEKWSTTREVREKKNLLKKIYKTTLSEDDNYWLSQSDGVIREAIDAGDIDDSRLDKLVAYDNMQVELGGSAQIGKKLRSLLGLPDIPEEKYGASKYSKSGDKKGKKGRALAPSSFESPLSTLTKYSVRGANLAASAGLGK